MIRLDESYILPGGLRSITQGRFHKPYGTERVTNGCLIAGQAIVARTWSRLHDETDISCAAIDTKPRCLSDRHSPGQVHRDRFPLTSSENSSSRFRAALAIPEALEVSMCFVEFLDRLSEREQDMGRELGSGRSKVVHSYSLTICNHLHCGKSFN